MMEPVRYLETLKLYSTHYGLLSGREAAGKGKEMVEVCVCGRVGEGRLRACARARVCV